MHLENFKQKNGEPLFEVHPNNYIEITVSLVASRWAMIRSDHKTVSLHQTFLQLHFGFPHRLFLVLAEILIHLGLLGASPVANRIAESRFPCKIAGSHGLDKTS
jgi:hypothetical protein